MILDEFFKPKPAAVLAEGLGDLRPTLGSKRDQGKSVRKWRKARGLGEQDMDNDNLYGGRPDDEVKFFIDSEPAYYAVMDRFGDHIDFRGDDMVAPLRLWSAIQQTAGDAGGAADIAGLEDEPMWVGDELDEQGMAENYPKHQDLSGISTDKLKAYVAKYTSHPMSGEGAQVRRVRAELERRMKGVAEGSDKIAANKQDRLQALENKLKAKGYTRTKDSDGGEYQYRWTRDGAPSYVVNYRSGANGYAEFRKEQGVSEGHGNYAGDRPVNLGGVSMKKIQIGDTVR